MIIKQKEEKVKKEESSEGDPILDELRKITQQQQAIADELREELVSRVAEESGLGSLLSGTEN